MAENRERGNVKAVKQFRAGDSLRVKRWIRRFYVLVTLRWQGHFLLTVAVLTRHLFSDRPVCTEEICHHQFLIGKWWCLLIRLSWMSHEMTGNCNKFDQRDLIFGQRQYTSMSTLKNAAPTCHNWDESIFWSPKSYKRKLDDLVRSENGFAPETSMKRKDNDARTGKLPRWFNSSLLCFYSEVIVLHHIVLLLLLSPMDWPDLKHV